MCVGVGDAVGLSEFFKPEGHEVCAGRINAPRQRPFNTFGPEGPHRKNKGKEIPARAAVRPLPLIGIVKVAPEEVSGHLIVKAHGVVAHGECLGLDHRSPDFFRKVVFAAPLRFGELRRDSGHQACRGLRQIVLRKFAVPDVGLSQTVKVHVGTDTGKLCRPVEFSVQAEGFIVMPVNRGPDGFFCFREVRHRLNFLN